MKIAVLGAGTTGCCLSRILADKGHSVILFEKESYLGGLCRTEKIHGYYYEVYGSHIFHTKKDNVWQFVSKHFELNSYTHMKGVVINGKSMPFVFNRLDGHVDRTNFKTAAISMFGEEVYNLVVENYTKKMWGVNPEDLSSDLAKRLKFREIEFVGENQGVPKNGYSHAFKDMLHGIPVYLNWSGEIPEVDLIIYTGSLDDLFRNCYGILPYRSLEFTDIKDEPWESDMWGTINLPQHSEYIRKCNFKVIYQDGGSNRVQYQKPAKGKPMYPQTTVAAIATFEKYLRLAVANYFPLGRLGLFTYINIDEAMEMAIIASEHIEWYKNASEEQRFSFLIDLRKGNVKT